MRNPKHEHRSVSNLEKRDDGKHIAFLLMQARLRKVYQRVRLALVEIEGHLEIDPERWGDPTYSLPGLKLQMFRRIYDELAVEYGVHTTEPVVFVSKIIPTLSHPLSDLFAADQGV